MTNTEHLSRYLKSTLHLQKVEELIPLGSQTFSKSRTQYPLSVSPLFLKYSKGCRSWDLDDNEYIDLVSSLAAVTLGYSDIDINNAVKAQIDLGVTLTLPGLLEFEVAQLINELVPSAEKIRFAKTGSDATAGAIRLARAFTKKDHILIGGYHGWQDWYIGTTSMNLGVPEAVQKISHSFTVNDFDSFESLLVRYENKIAGIILEPISYTSPTKEFLEYLRLRTTELGIVLIFDETVTGFRVAPGGAQEFFGVIPDLTTFGKAIANGFPLSVICGKNEIMKLMSDVFFSGTFGGELVSLAAAKSVLTKVRDEDVTGNLARIGRKLEIGVNEVLKVLDFKGLTLSGHPSWQFLNWDEKCFKDIAKVRTLFLQEMFFRGILVLGSHNINLSHDDLSIKAVVDAYYEVLNKIKKVEREDTYNTDLLVEPLKPLFKIR